MSESNSLPPEFDDLDWDSALDDWEKQAFGEGKRKEGGSLAGAGAGARKAAPSEMPPAETLHTAVTPIPPSPRPSSIFVPAEQPTSRNLSALDTHMDDEANATVIARVPQELLRNATRDERPSEQQVVTRAAARSPDDKLAPLEVITAEHVPVIVDLADAARDGEPSERSPDSGALSSAQIPLHAPNDRRFDPNEETTVVPRSALRGQRFEPASKKGEAASGALTPLPIPPAISAEDDGTLPRKRIAQIRPALRAAMGTDEATIPADARAKMRSRAEWLVEEAKHTGDPKRSASMLLTASELFALADDRIRARSTASLSVETDAARALGRLQKRKLAESGRDLSAHLDALSESVAASGSDAGRVHAHLLSGELLCQAGRLEEATVEFEAAHSLAPEDPRPFVGLFAAALSTHNYELARRATTLAKQIAPLRRGAVDVLRLRGISEEHSPTSNVAANDAALRARAALRNHDSARAVSALVELQEIPELAPAAAWLAASLAGADPELRVRAIRWLRPLAQGGDARARRALALRAAEIDDVAVREEALDVALVTPEERALLRALWNEPFDSAASLDAPAHSAPLRPLAVALTTIAVAAGGHADAESLDARAERLAGSDRVRSIGRAAKLVARSRGTASAEWGRAIDALEGRDDDAAGALRLASALGRGDFKAALRELCSSATTASFPLVIGEAIAAEALGDSESARRLYERAAELDPASEMARRSARANGSPIDSHASRDAELDEGGDAAVVDAIAALLQGQPGAGAAPGDSATRSTGWLEALRNWVTAVLDASREGATIAEAGSAFRAASVPNDSSLSAAILAAVDALATSTVDADATSTALERARAVGREDEAVDAICEFHQPAPLGESTDEVDPSAMRYPEGSVARSALFLEAGATAFTRGDRESLLRYAIAAAEGSTDAFVDAAHGGARILAASGAVASDAVGDGAPPSGLSRSVWQDATLFLHDDTRSAYAAAKGLLAEAPASVELHAIALALAPRQALDTQQTSHERLARLLELSAPAIAAGHAERATRLGTRAPNEGWDATYAMAELGQRLSPASASLLRLLDAHARARDDAGLASRTSESLAALTSRPHEQAALLLRASDRAADAGDAARALGLATRAAQLDAGDESAWRRVARLNARFGEVVKAAEAWENVARASASDRHQVEAWLFAATAWLDDASDAARGRFALEQAAAVDAGFGDVFDRLSAMYRQSPDASNRAALARLIATKTEGADPSEERTALDVERARLLIELGDPVGARAALALALDASPNRSDALSTYADLSISQEDWSGAEQALVRLSRLDVDDNMTLSVYRRLASIYGEKTANLPRAEVALREVLRRDADDVRAAEQLVDVYRRLGEGAKAVDMQLSLIDRADDERMRAKRLIELASLYEAPLHELRKAETALESARRELPGEPSIIRTLVEFYRRHRQAPAVQILLDRTASDARRAIATGKIAPTSFEMLAAVCELRGHKGASMVVRASAAAAIGDAAPVTGVGARGLNQSFDERIAPQELSLPIRLLFAQAGELLDLAVPFDLPSARGSASPVPPHLASHIKASAAALGLGDVKTIVLPSLGRSAIAASCTPPVLALGAEMVADDFEKAQLFLIDRALKLIRTRSAALVRAPESALGALLGAFVSIFNPTWVPPNVDMKTYEAALKKMRAGLPRGFDPDSNNLSMLALEAAGAAASAPETIAALFRSFATRTAMLAAGDLNAVFAGIGWLRGQQPPDAPALRLAWLQETDEARDALLFTVRDEYHELRTLAGAAD